MKKSIYSFKGFWVFLSASLLTVVSLSVNWIVQAEPGNGNLEISANAVALKSYNPKRESSPTVSVGAQTSVWLKLQEGKTPDTTFYGNDVAISALENNFAEPLSQVSADFNSDGYHDLVGGFRNAAGGGLISLHRANRQAFAPTDEQVFADLQRGIFTAAFEKDALILEVPTAPDFIITGKFSIDSAVDLVFASRGGHSIYLMTSDGKGGFNEPQEIAVGGEVTALASERLNYNGAHDGIVAAVSSGQSASLLVFSSDKDLMNTAPRAVPVESAVSSIILAKREAGAAEVKLFGLADGKLFTVSDIGGANNKVNTIELPYRAVDFAVGNFIADRRARNEIAVLADNGNVNYLTDATLDTRPVTKEKPRVNLRKYGRRSVPVNQGNTPETWVETEFYQLGIYAVQDNPSGLLRKAYLSGYETEDLMIVNGQANRVEVLFREPNRDENRSSLTGESKNQVVNFSSLPKTILPMRLNVMGQQGFVFFSEGSLEPKTVVIAPNATFTVSKTADTNDGTCNADCSLREAVVAANAAPGSDMITIPNGMFQLTRAGIDANAVNGDLDVLDAVAIVGSGSAGTFVQAGASAGTGIDKVFSINPNLTLSFAASMTNLTVRFGNNTSDGFGGGLDWDAGTTGTMTFNNTIATSNTLNSAGLGGGGYLFTSANTPGGGSITITNSTVSSNLATAGGVTTAIGGGIYVGNTPFSMTNVIFNGNMSKNNGGGLFIDPVTTASTGSSTFTGITFTNNSTIAANTDGGGIRTQRGLVVNSPIIISNNTATRFGGGIASDVVSASVNISKATMVGNSAGTNGGAIEVGSITTGNVLNMSFSRIVGNTGGGFNGLVSRGGTAVVENNWWGCNGGPNTAGCSTVGVVAPGTVDFNPWLRYTHTPSPSSIVIGQTSTLTASFLTNSAGTPIAVSNLDVLIGLPITFNMPVRGTISAAQATIQPNGTATATFTATMLGAGSANAAVDSGTATAAITIAQAATTTNITSDNPDPSVVGQTITVNYTVTVNSPGAGTPTGTVTVSDGVNMCSASVAAGSCNVALTTAGARTLTATYAGDANFTTSNDTEPHQVNMANTTTFITAESADPTAPGEVFTVFYAVVVNSPGAGTPTGTVTVSDGVDSCMGTAAAGQCSLALNTAGNRTLTATYGGNANFNGSVSSGEPHTVLSPTAASVEVSGRVMTQTGRAISRAQITITDQSGVSRQAITNALGYYRFTDVQAGTPQILSVRSKPYEFAPQLINPTGDINDLNFIAQ